MFLTKQGVFDISLETVVQHSEQTKVLPLEDIFNYTALSFLLEPATKAGQTEAEEEEEEIEVALDELEESLAEEEKDIPQIDYSGSDELFLLEQNYESAQGYVSKSYHSGITAELEGDEKYEAAEAGLVIDSEIMHSEEAKDAILEIQYATMLGSIHAADPDKRDRLSEFIMFYHSLFKLLERSCGGNPDVNYDPLV